MAQHSLTTRLVMVGLVVLLLMGASFVLLPSLSSYRKTQISKNMQAQEWRGDYISVDTTAAPAGHTRRPASELAQVRTFQADVSLTPGTSVGTARPESIYEARFTGKLTAINPGNAANVCELRLPLPPQIISLSDLKITVNGEPSQEVVMDGGQLIWQGRLGQDKPVPVEVTYTAVGKGIFTLQPPPGKIIEKFETTLTAHKTNVRMLELSLQPSPPQQKDGNTIYQWSFANLMFGRPITVDVLGIAPVDQLGELSWLGPISVLVFGLLMSLLILAYRPAQLSTWMVVLVVGTFAGCYPLMYFAQEFMSLLVAAMLSSLLVLVVIGVRAVTLFGLKLGVLGVLLMAVAVLTLTLSAAIWSSYQGLLLTMEAIGVLVVSMILLPKAQRNAVKPAVIIPPVPGTEAK